MSETAGEMNSTGPVIVARPGRYYRRARYIIVLAGVLVAPWFAYDGWVKWPQRNERIRALLDERDDAQRAGDTDRVADLTRRIDALGDIKNDASILIQKALALALPPASLVALLVWLYRSRGTYRLVGETLHVPGHPPVPLAAITRLDKSLWDRKGIARVTYQRPGTSQRTLTLDDFRYERAPTDEIVHHIETHLTTPSESERPAS